MVKCIISARLKASVRQELNQVLQARIEDGIHITTMNMEPIYIAAILEHRFNNLTVIG